MKKRLRKKLGKGEYADTGFRVIVQIPEDGDRFNEIVDHTVYAADEEGLLTWGHPSKAIPGAYAFDFNACTHCRYKANEEDREWARQWMRDHDLIVLAISPLMDSEKLVDIP